LDYIYNTLKTQSNEKLKLQSPPPKWDII